MSPGDVQSDVSVVQPVIVCYSTLRRHPMTTRILCWLDRTVTLWQTRLVWRMPRWVIRWAVVRAYAQAGANSPKKNYADLTYNDVYQAVETL